MSSAADRNARWPLWVLAALSLAFAVVSAGRRWFADDSFIPFRWAANLAHGSGLAWNAGEAATDVGAPIGWALLQSAAIRVGFDPVLFAWTLGAAAGIVLLWLLYSVGRNALHLPPGWALLAPAALCLQRGFVLGAVDAGPERPATALAFAGLAALTLEMRGPLRRRPWSGALFFGATFLWPLSAALHVAAAAGLALAAFAGRRVEPETQEEELLEEALEEAEEPPAEIEVVEVGAERRIALRAIALSLGLHVVLFGWLLALRALLLGWTTPDFGWGLAGGGLAAGLRWLARFPAATEGWLWGPLLAFGLLVVGDAMPDVAAALLAQWALFGAALVALGGGRTDLLALDPLLPAFALLLPVALRGLMHLRGEPAGRRRKIAFAVVGAALAALLASSSFRAPVSTAPAPTVEERRDAALAELDEAQALAQYLGPAERVAGPRIGLGPYIGGFHHVDPSGASPRDGRPLSFADLAAERTTFIDAYGRFLFDAPPPRGRAPATAAPWIGAGATLYTLEFPAGRERYFVFASAAPRGEIERWAAAKGLRFMDAAPLGAPSREPTLRN